MTTPLNSDSRLVITQFIEQVTSGDSSHLKNLTHTERKVLEKALETIKNNPDSEVKLDANVINKLKKNHNKNPIQSLVKGIMRSVFNDYTDRNSLATFIHQNADVIKKNIAKINNPPPPNDLPPTQPNPGVPKQAVTVDQPSPPSPQEKIENFKLQWKQNASNQSFSANYSLLRSLIVDNSISDTAVLKFLQDVEVRPQGGFFQTQGQQLERELSAARPEAFKKFIDVAKASDVGKTTGPTVASPSTVTNVNISNLDTKYRDIQSIAKRLTAKFPPTIPQVTFSDAEKGNLPKAQEAISNLEEHLKNKYAKDLANDRWHGRLSFQRILWQDEKFVQAIKDPLVVKLILSSAANNNEADLGDKNSISSLMLYGLGSNRLSYLVSAAPNWDNKPEGVEWKHFDDMRPTRNEKEAPWKVTPEYIQDLQAGLDSIRTVLASSVEPAPVDTLTTKIHEEINNASFSQLWYTFTELINDDMKISKLTFSKAGESTTPDRMAGQCFEVMANYTDALVLNNGDHAAVLGYGLVSHALDAKHLAAAIYVAENEKGEFNEKGKFLEKMEERYGKNSPVIDKGKSNLMNLFGRADDGELGPANNLLKIRLQQVLTLIIDNDIGIKPAEVYKVLEENGKKWKE